MELEDQKETTSNLLENSKRVNEDHIAGEPSCELKVYKRRWIILFIFIIYAAINTYQWIEYSIITNIVMKYYNVSATTVDWTSILFMVLYPPLVFPASYILDKMGLRVAGLIGALGTALGTGIKVLSTDRDSFWIVLIGQTILSIAQLMIFCLSPRIAAVWFKPSEVSTACSLGLFGTQVGAALGFALTPIVVKNHENVEDIGVDLRKLSWGLTAFVIPAAIAVIVYFPRWPVKPPSITQLEERNKKSKVSLKSFFTSVKKLMLNIPFVIHMIAYGINTGVFGAVAPLLNQVVLQYFLNAEEDVGRMGLLMIVTGVFGSVACGLFLDKTHKYKETTFFVYLMFLLSLVAFMVSLEMRSKTLVYISMAVYGFFTGAYLPVGFEMAIELTFPSSETTTSGLLTATCQALGTVFLLVMGQVNALIGPFWALGTQVLLLAIGTIITALVPNKLRRQEAFKRGICENVTSNETDH